VGLLYLRPGYKTSQVSLYFNLVLCSEWSPDSSVSIVTLLWTGSTKNIRSIVDSNKRLIYFARHPDRLWCSSSACWKFVPGIKVAGP
jgi:hypothetical protein